MQDPSGHRLLPYVLIRGDACLVVPMVRDRETGEERFVMVRQRRSGSGLAALEFPAGMLDRLVDDPVRVAAEELAEETGIRAQPDDLFPLADRPLFTSPGLQDEAIHYFGYETELSHREFKALEGRRTGNGDEGERIQVTLATRAEGEAGSVSTQVRLGFYLLEAAVRLRPGS
jgi:8-oxo-dGTP pyrophosphatase MutT (NUDIX family)